jgi:hypothetical protein
LRSINTQKKEGGVFSGWLKLAAVILLLALSAPILWLTVFQNDQSVLIDQELDQPYPLSTLDRSSSDGTPANEAYEFYVKREYKNAIAAFDKIPGNVSDSVSITFYNGLSNLYAGQYQRAILLLSSNSLEASRYEEQASWFSSLALIKAGRMVEAKESLNRIINTNGHYKSTTARQVLKEIQ